MARRRAGRERWRGIERGESGGKAHNCGRAFDFIKRAGRRAPKLAGARPLFPARARSFPDVPAIFTIFSTFIFILYLIFISTLFSTIIFILYLIFISTSLLFFKKTELVMMVCLPSCDIGRSIYIRRIGRKLWQFCRKIPTPLSRFANKAFPCSYFSPTK